EAAAIYRELGAKWQLGFTLLALARMHTDQGDYSTARSLCEESLSTLTQVGTQWGIVWTLDAQAEVAMRQGDYERARSLREESFAEGVGAQGQTDRAARLLGAAQALRETLGAPLPPVERPDDERQKAIVRSAMGEEPFAAAWEEGRAMVLEQAVTYALAEGPD